MSHSDLAMRESSGPYFDKAWQRRDHEFEQAMLERDMRRFGHARKILPPPALPLTKLPAPKPSRGGSYTPLTWSADELRRLNAWRRDDGARQTVSRIR